MQPHNFFPALWQKLGSAGKLGCTSGLCTLGLALAWAGYGYWDQVQIGEREFLERAKEVLRCTAPGPDSHFPVLDDHGLRQQYQLEVSRGVIQQIVLLEGNRTRLASSVDLEGVDASLVMGDDRILDNFEPSNFADPLVSRFNDSLNRFEVAAVIRNLSGAKPTWLYLATPVGGMRQKAWQRFYSIATMGFVLGIASWAIAYGYARRYMILPMRKLQTRIETTGLAGPLGSEELGNLQELILALEAAVRRLLEKEQQELGKIKTELHEADEESVVQTELIRCLVKDLRASMSAILGHAELLLSGDRRPADRINHIRLIQQESRRISHLSHELSTLLSSSTTADVSTSRRAGLPLSQLRKVTEDLLVSRSYSLADTKADTVKKDSSEPRGAEPTQRTGLKISAPESSVKTRLCGSILVVGRSDEICQALVLELNELGLGTVWVPDVPAAEAELGHAHYDMVIVNLCRNDLASFEIPTQLRESYPGLTLIAVLPDSARGDGGRSMHLGCADYLYAPISRRGVLAVVGKYLGFKPVS